MRRAREQRLRCRQFGDALSYSFSCFKSCVCSVIDAVMIRVMMSKRSGYLDLDG